MHKKLSKLFAVTLVAAVMGSNVPVNQAEAATNSNQVVYQGHVYQLVEKGMTWSQAKRYCEKQGGHLVTITSNNEFKKVKTLLKKGKKNNYWVGGKRTASGDWKWITGEKFKYANWSYGQPDNYTRNENAIMIYRCKNPANGNTGFGQWNDIDMNGTCNAEEFFGKSKFGFICEWEATAPKTPSVSGINKKNGTIKGKTSKNVTVYIRIDTTTYSGKSDKTGKYTIKTKKIKAGTKIKLWAKNKYKLRSNVKNINVY